jgi:hypothetical protein
VCSKARWNQKALACDDCDQWFHTTCMGVSNIWQPGEYISVMVLYKLQPTKSLNSTVRP